MQSAVSILFLDVVGNKTLVVIHEHSLHSLLIDPDVISHHRVLQVANTLLVDTHPLDLRYMRLLLAFASEQLQLVDGLPVHPRCQLVDVIACQVARLTRLNNLSEDFHVLQLLVATFLRGVLDRGSVNLGRLVVYLVFVLSQRNRAVAFMDLVLELRILVQRGPPVRVQILGSPVSWLVVTIKVVRSTQLLQLALHQSPIVHFKGAAEPLVISRAVD